jgi:hypothetical protein
MRIPNNDQLQLFAELPAQDSHLIPKCLSKQLEALEKQRIQYVETGPLVATFVSGM